MERKAGRRMVAGRKGGTAHYAGGTSPISSQPIRRHKLFPHDPNLTWVSSRPSPTPVQVSPTPHPSSTATPKPVLSPTSLFSLVAISTSQHYFRPHSAVKRRPKPSPSPPKPTPSHLPGPQILTSQWTLERINSLLQLRIRPKTAKGKGEYVGRRVERARTVGRERKVMKDQGNGTVAPRSEKRRPRTTESKSQRETLPRPHSEEHIHPPAVLFQNESIRDWYGKVPEDAVKSSV